MESLCPDHDHDDIATHHHRTTFPIYLKLKQKRKKGKTGNSDDSEFVFLQRIEIREEGDGGLVGRAGLAFPVKLFS